MALSQAIDQYQEALFLEIWPYHSNLFCPMWRFENGLAPDEMIAYEGADSSNIATNYKI